MAEVFEIIEFLKVQTGADDITEYSDIVNDMGADGDDYDELVYEFSNKYNVDISSYLWYFHCSEEGSWNSIGGSFFKSPDNRVEHISVTPMMLADFTKVGKWDLQYPEHSLPKRRYDIMINQFLIFAFIVFILYRCTS